MAKFFFDPLPDETDTGGASCYYGKVVNGVWVDDLSRMVKVPIIKTPALPLEYIYHPIPGMLFTEGGKKFVTFGTLKGDPSYTSQIPITNNYDATNTKKTNAIRFNLTDLSFSFGIKNTYDNGLAGSSKRIETKKVTLRISKIDKLDNITVNTIGAPDNTSVPKFGNSVLISILTENSKTCPANKKLTYYDGIQYFSETKIAVLSSYTDRFYSLVLDLNKTATRVWLDGVCIYFELGDNTKYGWGLTENASTVNCVPFYEFIKAKTYPGGAKNYKKVYMSLNNIWTTDDVLYTDTHYQGISIMDTLYSNAGSWTLSGSTSIRDIMATNSDSKNLTHANSGSPRTCQLSYTTPTYDILNKPTKRNLILSFVQTGMFVTQSGSDTETQLSGALFSPHGAVSHYSIGREALTSLNDLVNFHPTITNVGT
jgi:hypothetical protein